MFVNQIADIVHINISMYYGTVNKNLGDTFLLLWKIPELDSNFEGDLDSVIINEAHVADLSIYGCLSSIAKINTYEHLWKYRKDPEINKILPNYHIEILFGLHTGCAFEGAVGSQWKIDATHVSPDVTVAARLNLATEYYGVPILFSEARYN